MRARGATLEGCEELAVERDLHCVLDLSARGGLHIPNDVAARRGIETQQIGEADAPLRGENPLVDERRLRAEELGCGARPRREVPRG